MASREAVREHLLRGRLAAQQAAEKAAKFGVKDLEVRVKGPGSGRESAITALQAAGMNMKSIEDITPLPHNGCRPPKEASRLKNEIGLTASCRSVGWHDKIDWTRGREAWDESLGRSVGSAAGTG